VRDERIGVFSSFEIIYQNKIALLALTLQVVLLRRVPLHEASSVFYFKTHYPRYFFRKNLPLNCTLSTPGVK